MDARQFEELVVGLIRSNILTEGNIRSLVNVVDEQMDDVAGDERKRLETIESELADVRGRLDRLYDLVETTTEFNMADFAHRIRNHKERQERLESAAEGARAILAQRRAVLDDVKTITAYAKDMSRFLQKSELTERRAFIETFVKEIELLPDNAVVRYTIPISQSTRKAQVLMGGRFGCDRVKVRRTDRWGATSALMIGSELSQVGLRGQESAFVESRPGDVSGRLSQSARVVLPGLGGVSLRPR